MRGERGDLQRDVIAIWPAQTEMAPPSTGANLDQQPQPPLHSHESEHWVARVDDAETLLALLDSPPPGLEWIEVQGLLENLELWRSVAQKKDATFLDVVMQDPAAEFSRLYRLVDVYNARSIGVTIPVRPGFPKALKLAASIGLPVRLLPGQPDEAALIELNEALSLYLYDPMLEAPVEFFHSVLSYFHGYPCSDLWTLLQEDPGAFPRYNKSGQVLMPRSAAVFSEMDTTATPAGFVERHVQHLLDSGAECALCPWLGICQGYFKWPDENYSCAKGVIPLFERLKQTAEDMQEALVAGGEQGCVASVGMEAAEPHGDRNVPTPWEDCEPVEPRVLQGASAPQGTGRFLSPLSGDHAHIASTPSS